MAPSKPSKKAKLSIAAAATTGGDERIAKSAPTKTNNKTLKKTVSKTKAVDKSKNVDKSRPDDGVAKDGPDKKIEPVALNDTADIIEEPAEDEAAVALNDTTDVVEEAPEVEAEPDINKIEEDVKKHSKTPTKKEKQTFKDAATYHPPTPKTAQDVEKGYRALQAEISKTGKHALEAFAEIQAAKGSGMSFNQQTELQIGFYNNLDAVHSLLKDLNNFRTQASVVAANDRAHNRAAMLPSNDALNFEPPQRLIFEDPSISRASTLQYFKPDDIDADATWESNFKITMLRTLLDHALAMAGAEREEADVMIDTFTDPGSATTVHDDPISALTSLKTLVGVPVFVPGSRLEQIHRAISEELFGLLDELKRANDNIEKAVAEAAENDGRLAEKAEKKAPGRPRKPREKKPKEEGEEDVKKAKKVKKEKVEKVKRVKKEQPARVRLADFGKPSVADHQNMQ